MKSILFRKNVKSKGMVYIDDMSLLMSSLYTIYSDDMSSLFPKFGQQIFSQRAGETFLAGYNDDTRSIAMTLSLNPIFGREFFPQTGRAKF